MKAPPLPVGRKWLPETRAWWADIWSSPMAAEWHSSDRHGLFVLAALVDDFWDPKADHGALAGEIRLQRQAFGLTPLDRRRLQWEIERAEEAVDRGSKRRKAPLEKKKPAKDPRLTLVAFK